MLGDTTLRPRSSTSVGLVWGCHCADARAEKTHVASAQASEMEKRMYNCRPRDCWNGVCLLNRVGTSDPVLDAASNEGDPNAHYVISSSEDEC